jgi:ectoine hydroxylase-related dioxygenase (phytanoyl-CoA dioxygenase family)
VGPESVPEVDVVPLETLELPTSASEVADLLRRDGALIVRNVLDPDEVARINRETAPWIDATPQGRDDFSGRLTRRTGALVARSEACRDVVMHPLVLGAAENFLGPYCDRIQLHLTQTIAIFPGESAQALHRDRLAWGGHIPEPIEPQFNTIWALTDFTVENGATHVIPGSHHWPADRNGEPDESVRAEMPAGSVLFYSGTVVHGGGANRSTEPRIGLNITYCLSWLRQEENQFLSCPPEVARTLPPELTNLLGYTMSNYALGYYSYPTRVEGQAGLRPPEAALGRKPDRRHDAALLTGAS